MKYLLKISVVVIFFLSCKGSADKKALELANARCGCFDSFQNNLSEAGKKLMKEVSTAAKPQEVLIAGMAKLKPEDAKAFAEQLQSIAKVNSPVYKCMQEFDKIHSKETTTDKNALTEKVLMEMQRSGNCYVGAAIINLSPKQH